MFHRYLSDAALVRATLGKRPWAFERLIGRYQGKATAIALAIGVRPDLLQDVLQQSFLFCFRDLAQLRQPASFGPWFLGIVRNVARKSVRRKGPASLPLPPVSGNHQPFEEVEMREVYAGLWRAVQGLPEGVREAMCLYYYEGGSIRDVANALQISRSAVKERLRRGRASLREKMWHRFGDAIAEMVPTPARSRRRARHMALFVMSTVGLETVRGGPSSALAGAPACETAGGNFLAGVMGVGGMKLLAFGVVVLAVVAGGVIWYERDRGAGTDPGTTLSAIDDRDGGNQPEAGVGRSAREPRATGKTEDAESAPTLPRPVDLDRIDRDREIFGVVVDAEGAPVAGALLETFSYPWRRARLRDEGVASTSLPGPVGRSASDGSFAIRLPWGSVVDLRVSAEGFAIDVIPRSLAGGRVDVVLQRPAPLEVNVQDEQGAPVIDARVRFRKEEQLTPTLEEGGITDRNGACLLARVGPGKGRVHVLHPRLGDPGWVGVDIRAGRKNSIEVVMPSGRTLTGRVTAAHSGEPLEGARVYPHGLPGKSVVTDPDGRYEFSGWTPGRMESLTASAEGYGRQGKKVGEALTVDLALPRGYDVVGRVLTGEGSPLEGALAAAEGIAKEYKVHWLVDGVTILDGHYTKTGKDGRFELRGLPEDVRHGIHILSPAGEDWFKRLNPREVEGDRLDLGSIVFEGAGSIEGVAIDSAGTPLRGAVVTLNMSEFQRTDDLGRFRFPNVEPGTHALSLAADGFPEIAESVILEPGQVLRDVRLAFSQGRSITVRLEDRSGAPVAGMGIVVHTSALGHMVLETGPDGQASCQGLPDREIFVEPAGDSSFVRPEGRTIVPRGQEVRFVLRETGLVRGSVEAPDGTRLPGMDIHLGGPGESGQVFPGVSMGNLVARTDRHGDFELRLPRGSAVDLVVPGLRDQDPSPNVYRWQVTPFRGEARGILPPDSDVRIVAREVALDRSVHVVVLDEHGDPMGDLDVSTRNRAGPLRNDRTDQEGRVTLDGLPSEEVLISARSVWSAPSPGAAEIQRRIPPPPVVYRHCSIRTLPDDQELTLRFAPGVHLRGTVNDLDGKPARSVGVYAIDEATGDLIARSQSDVRGRFSLVSPEGLSCRIEAEFHVSGSTRLAAAVEGVRGPVGEIVLNLSWPR